MSDLPSMPLFVDDFEAHTNHLTLEEDGAYNRLLRLCWRQSECSVPDDRAWIMRRMRCDAATYDRLVQPIIEEFFTRSDGRIWQKRQRREHAYVLNKIDARKQAGSKGGKAKALKTKKTDASKTTNLPEQNSSKTLAPTLTLTPTPTPTSDTNVSEKTRRRAARVLKTEFDEEFAKIWPAYPRHTGEAVARKEWAAARRKHSYEDLAGPLRKYIQAVRDTEVRFIAKLSTWLKEERWKDNPDHARNRPRTSTEDLENLATITSTEDLANLFPFPARKALA